MDTEDFVLVEMSFKDYVIMKKYVQSCVERIQKSRDRNRKMRGSKKETVDDSHNVPFFYIKQTSKAPSQEYVKEHVEHIQSRMIDSPED